MSVFSELRIAMRKRAAYRRTRNEISKLPLETALDLDIYPGDAARLARQAVYG